MKEYVKQIGDYVISSNPHFHPYEKYQHERWQLDSIISKNINNKKISLYVWKSLESETEYFSNIENELAEKGNKDSCLESWEILYSKEGSIYFGNIDDNPNQINKFFNLDESHFKLTYPTQGYLNMKDKSRNDKYYSIMLFFVNRKEEIKIKGIIDTLHPFYKMLSNMFTISYDEITSLLYYPERENYSFYSIRNPDEVLPENEWEYLFDINIYYKWKDIDVDFCKKNFSCEEAYNIRNLFTLKKVYKRKGE